VDRGNSITVLQLSTRALTNTSHWTRLRKREGEHRAGSGEGQTAGAEKLVYCTPGMLSGSAAEAGYLWRSSVMREGIRQRDSANYFRAASAKFSRVILVRFDVVWGSPDCLAMQSK
jgi:hypothetical protein